MKKHLCRRLQDEKNNDGYSLLWQQMQVVIMLTGQNKRYSAGNVEFNTRRDVEKEPNPGSCYGFPELCPCPPSLHIFL